MTKWIYRNIFMLKSVQAIIDDKARVCDPLCERLGYVYSSLAYDIT
jgi:hypothetical protein